jgi:3-hydroxy-D-aspartate aldolase
MLQPPPARPGMREDEVDTPALLIDLDAFEYNLGHMAELLAPPGQNCGRTPRRTNRR